MHVCVCMCQSGVARPLCAGFFPPTQHKREKAVWPRETMCVCLFIMTELHTTFYRYNRALVHPGLITLSPATHDPRRSGLIYSVSKAIYRPKTLDGLADF